MITTFTPGPNNISSASMGILSGYRKTLPYLIGIAIGFYFVMMLCGWISASLRQIFPSFEQILRLFGAGYILWLAWHTLKASYVFKEEGQALFGATIRKYMNRPKIQRGINLFLSLLLIYTAIELSGRLNLLFPTR